MANEIEPVAKFPDGWGDYSTSGELKDWILLHAPQIGEALEAGVRVSRDGFGLSAVGEHRDGLSFIIYLENGKAWGHQGNPVNWSLNVGGFNLVTSGIATELDVMPPGYGVRLRRSVSGSFGQQVVITPGFGLEMKVIPHQ